MKTDYVVVCGEWNFADMPENDSLRVMNGIHINEAGSILCKREMLPALESWLGEAIEPFDIMTPEEYLECEWQQQDISITYDCAGRTFDVAIDEFAEAVCMGLLSEDVLSVVSDWFDEATKCAYALTLDHVMETVAESVRKLKTEHGI